MTFDESKQEFRAFLENSTVNLGRKTATTRFKFIETAMAMFQAFEDSVMTETDDVLEPSKPQNADSMDDRIKCIKPKDRREVFDAGKGVHVMTANESARADEQLGRSPFGKGKKNE